jgi:hypothetical protein
MIEKYIPQSCHQYPSATHRIVFSQVSLGNVYTQVKLLSEPVMEARLATLDSHNWHCSQCGEISSQNKIVTLIFLQCSNLTAAMNPKYRIGWSMYSGCLKW